MNDKVPNQFEIDFAKGASDGKKLLEAIVGGTGQQLAESIRQDRKIEDLKKTKEYESFLRGLFEADGCISKSYEDFEDLKNLKKIEDLKNLKKIEDLKNEINQLGLKSSVQVGSLTGPVGSLTGPVGDTTGPIQQIFTTTGPIQNWPFVSTTRGENQFSSSAPDRAKSEEQQRIMANTRPTPPENPAIGNVWTDTNTGKIRVWTGTTWVEITPITEEQSKALPDWLVPKPELPKIGRKILDGEIT